MAIDGKEEASAVWQDREIRFDVHPSHLDMRSGARLAPATRVRGRSAARRCAPHALSATIRAPFRVRRRVGD